MRSGGGRRIARSGEGSVGRLTVCESEVLRCDPGVLPGGDRRDEGPGVAILTLRRS